VDYRLDHIALDCKDLSESVRYYEKYFGASATPTRKGGDGRNFCFVNISGAAAIQLIETGADSGINHYGFVAGDIEQVANELRAKNAEIIREIRSPDGKLTTLFVKDCNGLKMEVRLPR
jgi:catechol 2,3-dioxygenase-like lactoylglutathione lyase family enzyme